MPNSSTPTPPVETRPVSKTNPQCKVCTSPDRAEIEIALARGQSQESVATRFSRHGQSFNRQNIHNHYHKHMQVLDLAVAEEAARRGLSPMLDLERATQIHAEHEHNRARLRAQVDARIKEGLPWTTRDLLAFMEQDIRLEEQRNEQRAENIMMQARIFGEAVRKVAPIDMQGQIREAYAEIYARRSGAEPDDSVFDDATLDEERSQEAS
jgi:hypothetical protein